LVSLLTFEKVRIAMVVIFAWIFWHVFPGTQNKKCYYFLLIYHNPYDSPSKTNPVSWFFSIPPLYFFFRFHAVTEKILTLLIQGKDKAG
jgi:hypothetical protein